MTGRASYDTFFVKYGQVLHLYSNYWELTQGNTKHQTVELNNWMLVNAGKAEQELASIFPYIHAAYEGKQIIDQQYRRYLTFLKLIIDDPSILANKIKADPKILLAVKSLTDGKKK